MTFRSNRKYFTLQGIGCFIKSLDDEDFPAPQELVGNDPRLLAVADYLDKGLVYMTYRGISQCKFCGERMGHSDLTDGTWVWPRILSHYLRAHSVCLPEEFIQHSLSGKEIVSAPVRHNLSYSLWIDWAKPQRSPVFRQRILDARIESARLSELARDRAILENTMKYGEGDRKCIESGCSRRALQSMFICAEHLPEMSESSHFNLHSTILLREAINQSF